MYEWVSNWTGDCIYIKMSIITVKLAVIRVFSFILSRTWIFCSSYIHGPGPEPGPGFQSYPFKCGMNFRSVSLVKSSQNTLNTLIFPHSASQQTAKHSSL